MDKAKELTYLFEKMTDKISLIFEIDKPKAFTAATFMLSQPKLPLFKNLSLEDNESIQSYFKRYKSETYSIPEIRLAFNEAYLFSLREKESVEVETSSELIILYLRLITLLIRSHMDYEHVMILNPSSNSGSLITAISSDPSIDSKDVFVVEDRESFSSLTQNLRDLTKLQFEVSNSLPQLSYRCDIIVSDPFLRNVEDILIFFEDYHDYLNRGGFMVLSLMTEFVRSRVFTDNLERYGLKLVGLIEYPKDLYGGLIKNSIVVLEYKDDKNKEFFHAEMPSIKNIEANQKVLKEIKEYLNNYFGGNKQ
ncbi:MAG: hypothetical protein K6G38_00295 [Gammaproteobacteria bacterium]|nr:hypothetical protein [Gammaproteobacteria bacterium]